MTLASFNLRSILVSLPQMIATTSLDPESVQIIRDYSNELLLYSPCLFLFCVVSDLLFVDGWCRKKDEYSSKNTKTPHLNIKLVLGRDAIPKATFFCIICTTGSNTHPLI